jgi:hypothetical protein
VPPSAVDLLRSMRRTLGEGTMLLIGLDRLKDPRCWSPPTTIRGRHRRVQPQPIARINRELGGDSARDAFAHRALWNDDLARIEMQLVRLRAVRFTSRAANSRWRRRDHPHREQPQVRPAQRATLAARRRVDPAAVVQAIAPERFSVPGRSRPSRARAP